MHPIGEIVLIRIGFHQGPGGKVRPAIIVLDSGDDDVVAAPVTSQSRQSPYDLAIADWPGAGLNVASSIRIDKLTVLAKTEVIRRLGMLTPSDRESLRSRLCETFCP
jgi:mRNA interferase MazF